jgi:hypothetical protein
LQLSLLLCRMLHVLLLVVPFKTEHQAFKIQPFCCQRRSIWPCCSSIRSCRRGHSLHAVLRPWQRLLAKPWQLN